MVAPRVTWDAFYYDGQTAQRHEVRVEVSPTGLWIVRPEGERVQWPYDEIRQTQGKRAGDPVRLERGQEQPEVLVVADPTIVDAIREAAPSFGSRFASAAGGRLRGKAAVLGALGAIALGALCYFVGLPVLAARVAAKVPIEWEERIGSSVVADLVPEEQACAEPERQQALEAAVERLTDAMARSPYRFRVTIVDNSLVNAFAAPGGYIVVFQGLLETVETPDELAGVLAHEIQHVVQRHGTTAMLEEIPLRLVVAAITGDAGIAGQVLNTAAALGALRYRRQDESAADREAMRVLQAARIAPDGMIRFFERLETEGDDVPAVVAYLSTHPRHEARIEALRKLAADARYQPIPLLTDAQWAALRMPCGSGAATPS